MRLVSVTAVLFISAAVMPAGIIFTHEAPGVEHTTVATASTETFNALALGTSAFSGAGYLSPAPSSGTDVGNGGRYTGDAFISAPDSFGGSNKSDYINVTNGPAPAVTRQYAVSFLSPVFYFGFYWSAGDANNQVLFYLGGTGGTLVDSFAVGDIIPTLSANYNNNPDYPTGCAALANCTVGNHEPYVYLDFTSADLASSFDTVVFRNRANGSFISAFESDNHAVNTFLIPPPGVPEPSTYALMASGIAGVLLMLKRRRRQA